LVYVLFGLWSGHFRKNLLPAPADRKLRAFWEVIANYLHRTPPDDTRSYNVMQRTAYLIVIFVLFPLVIWTGLAMSPAFDSAIPAAVNVLGGRQSARTLHFFVSGFLLLFVVIHVTMVLLGGFRTRTRAMITGNRIVAPERTLEPTLVEVEGHP
jgi:thiosulfate reductase cytochrome b subunit